MREKPDIYAGQLRRFLLRSAQLFGPDAAGVCGLRAARRCGGRAPSALPATARSVPRPHTLSRRSRLGVRAECSRNPAFMLSSCRSDCEAWEKEHGLKIDRDSSCVEWSILGRCDKEPEWMAKTCNTSCTVHRHCARSTFTGWSVGICDKALRCEARDKRSDCASRAARGGCASDPTTMAVSCLSTCAAKDVDSVLAAQRPEMRAILSPHYDLSRRSSRAHSRCWLPGWSGHNTYKLMLPTECAATRRVAWQRRRRRRGPLPERRVQGAPEDALTCPVDVGATTPRVAVERQHVSILPHTPHNVTVVQVLASPRIRLLRDFLTAAEAAEILRLAEPSFHRSPVRSVATDRRTSWTATLGGGMLGIGGGNWAIKRVRQRIAAFSGYDDHMLEPLQVVRYHPGEKYEAHHDLFDLCDFPQKPRRHLTFLIYLNDLPEGAGGDTTFPRLNLRVRPERHMALVFNDVLDNGMDDERTEHSGTAPTTGVKYAINWCGAETLVQGLAPDMHGMSMRVARALRCIRKMHHSHSRFPAPRARPTRVAVGSALAREGDGRTRTRHMVPVPALVLAPTQASEERTQASKRSYRDECR